jgi:hypothetical protein
MKNINRVGLGVWDAELLLRQVRGRERVRAAAGRVGPEVAGSRRMQGHGALHVVLDVKRLPAGVCCCLLCGRFHCSLACSRSRLKPSNTMAGGGSHEQTEMW